MKPLHARSRALIEAARPAEEPSLDDRSRVRARVMASVVGAAVVVASASAEAAGAGGAAGAAGTAAKGAVVGATGAVAKGGVVAGATGAVAKGAVVAGATGAVASTGVGKAVIVGALLGLFASGAVEVVLPPSSPAVVPAEVVSAPMVVTATPLVTSSPAESARPSVDDGARPATPESSARASARPSPTAAASGVASVREEVELLKDAQRAIAAGDNDRALQVLDAHASRFEGGALRAERLAARAIALCGAGRDVEARAALSELFAAEKGSVHETRVRAACARVLTAGQQK